ncbi:MAG TPA: FKBP-type peptidyl-prolyl cis-trans isomerase, partial [Terracidiphilus sp.]
MTVRYSGYLNRGDAFPVGPARHVRGWSAQDRRGILGVDGMRVGGRRRLRVGPHLAHGDKGVPGLIPPNAKLVSEVELLAV